MIALTLAEVADGHRRAARRFRDRSERCTGRRRRRLAAGRAPARSSSRCRASTSTGTTSRRRPSRPARWRCWPRGRSACPRWWCADPQRRARRGSPRPCVDRLPESIVVGITGSQGKTSTKDLLAQVLQRRGPTRRAAGVVQQRDRAAAHRAAGDDATRTSSLEMGARGVATSPTCAGIAPPRIGVVLNVGTAHVGEFGDREAIAAAKGELVEALPRATAESPSSTPTTRSSRMAERTDAAVVMFGESVHADVRAERRRASTSAAGPRSLLVTPAGRRACRCSWYGEHHVRNALAAAAVALTLGLSIEQVAAGLSGGDVADAAGGWRSTSAPTASPSSTTPTTPTPTRARRARGAGRARAWPADLGGARRDARARRRRAPTSTTRSAGSPSLGVTRLVVVGEGARAVAHGRRARGLVGRGVGVRARRRRRLALLRQRAAARRRRAGEGVPRRPACDSVGEALRRPAVRQRRSRADDAQVLVAGAVALFVALFGTPLAIRSWSGRATAS